MKYGCKNKLKVNPLAYNLMLIGESGIGKTTVIKEYCDRLAPDKYIFLECNSCYNAYCRRFAGRARIE